MQKVTDFVYKLCDQMDHTRQSDIHILNQEKTRAGMSKKPM